MLAPSNKDRPWKISRHLVLDGGLATELERSGLVTNINDDPLWSARYLKQNPRAIKAVHTSFLESGADVIITATYQASVEGFQEHLGLSAEQSLELIKQGTVLAQEAVDEFWDKCWSQELVNWHRPRIKALVESQVDLLALETIPAQKEAVALALLLKEFPDITAWLTFSCKDAQLTCHGEHFADAVATVIQNTPQIIATGVNCCSPLVVQPLLEAIHGKINLPFVVYPNSGEIWNSEAGWHDSGVKIGSIASFVPSWIESGACWIGGCCRTTPTEIAEIRLLLDQYPENTKLGTTN